MTKTTTFAKPGQAAVRAFLLQQKQAVFSYPEIGFTEIEQAVKDYNNDHNRVMLGTGQAVFDKACEALRQWKMFPGDWAWIEPAGAPQVPGENLAMVAKVAGLYWINACRVVYAIDQKLPIRRFGFAYGTLPNHIECGEERFSVEMLPDGTVWYDLKAFSYPRLWLVKLAYPWARHLQRRFVLASMAAMQRAVDEDASKTHS